MNALSMRRILVIIVIMIIMILIIIIIRIIYPTDTATSIAPRPTLRLEQPDFE